MPEEHRHLSENVRERIGAAVLELTAAGKPELAKQLLDNFDEAERRVIKHGVVPGCPLCAEAAQRLDPKGNVDA